MTTCTLCGVGYWLVLLFRCDPIKSRWDLNPDHHGKCIAPKTFIDLAYAAGTINAASDITFAIIPMVLVWGTSLNFRTRCTICAILGLGSVICVVTLVRIAFAHELLNQKVDFLYNITNISLLSAAEIGLGIVVACCVTYKPLVQQWLGTDSSSRQKMVMGRINQYGNGERAMRPETLQYNTAATNISTITGRESMSEMPDLVMAGSEDEKGTPDVHVKTSTVRPSIPTINVFMMSNDGDTRLKEFQDV